ncbi:MAG: hypothetical protein ABSG43_08805 [Solirubrobacteraceae bacterium]
MARCAHCHGSVWIIVDRANVCAACRRPYAPRAPRLDGDAADRAADSAPPDGARERELERAARRRQEDGALERAHAALARCTYLGDSLEFPEHAPTLHMVGSVGADGVLSWVDRRGEEHFAVNWSDLVALEVAPVDSQGEVVGAERGALRWVGKRRRREAVLCVKAKWGQARLLVHGQAPSELDLALAPLRACLDRTPAGEPMRAGDVKRVRSAVSLNDSHAGYERYRAE